MIVLKIKEICKKRGFNSKILERASPYKEIRDGYLKMLSSFFTGIPLFMFEENNNKKYSQERKIEILRIIEKDYEKIFDDYLEEIKQKYPENIWKIESKGDKNEKEEKK